jgi:hypothetical protein
MVGGGGGDGSRHGIRRAHSKFEKCDICNCLEVGICHHYEVVPASAATSSSIESQSLQILASTLLWAALGLSVTACTTKTVTPPPDADVGPATACRGSGGTYLGKMQCQLANGSVVPILAGAEAVRARASSIVVAPQSPHSWALATTAIIFQANGDRHDLLAGAIVTTVGVEKGRRLLSRWWDVNNRDELLRILTWLQFEGYRSSFEAMARQVDVMNEQQLLAVKAELATNPEELHKLEVVTKHHRVVGRNGIAAWDLVRYIALCRWGYLAGYLSEQEAWDHIMPAALRLQEMFGSWQELQSDYLIGREFWSTEQTQANGDRFRVIYAQFVEDPGSPWNVNPWKMNLGVSEPLPLTAN